MFSKYTNDIIEKAIVSSVQYPSTEVFDSFNVYGMFEYTDFSNLSLDEIKTEMGEHTFHLIEFSKILKNFVSELLLNNVSYICIQRKSLNLIVYKNIELKDKTRFLTVDIDKFYEKLNIEDEKQLQNKKTFIIGCLALILGTVIGRIFI